MTTHGYAFSWPMIKAFRQSSAWQYTTMPSVRLWSRHWGKVQQDSTWPCLKFPYDQGIEAKFSKTEHGHAFSSSMIKALRLVQHDNTWLCLQLAYDQGIEAKFSKTAQGHAFSLSMIKALRQSSARQHMAMPSVRLWSRHWGKIQQDSTWPCL